MTDKALYIVHWHDPQRGCEPRSRQRGKMQPLLAPIGRYQARVHSGRSLARLVAVAGGLPDGLAAAAVYELLCQWTCQFWLERRGFILDRSGRSPAAARDLLALLPGAASEQHTIGTLLERSLSNLTRAGWVKSLPTPKTAAAWEKRRAQLLANYALAWAVCDHQGAPLGRPTSASASASARGPLPLPAPAAQRSSFGALAQEGGTEPEHADAAADAEAAPCSGRGDADADAVQAETVAYVESSKRAAALLFRNGVTPTTFASESADYQAGRLLQAAGCDVSFRRAVGEAVRRDPSLLRAVAVAFKGLATRRQKPKNPGGWMRTALRDSGMDV